MPIDPNIIAGLHTPTPPPVNPLGDLQTIMQIRQAQAEAPYRIQQLQQNAQEGALKMQETQQAINERKASDAAWLTSAVPDPKTGMLTTDPDKGAQALIQGGNGHLVPAFQKATNDAAKSRSDLQEAQLKVKTAQANHAASIGAQWENSGYDPAFVKQSLAQEVASGATTQQNAQRVSDQIDTLLAQDPTGASVKPFLQTQSNILKAQGDAATQRGFAAGQQAQTGAAKLPGDLAIQAATVPKLQAEATVQQQKATGTEPIQPADQAKFAFDQQRMNNELSRTVEAARHNRMDEAETQRYHNQSFEGVQLTDDAKAKMAEMFAVTGVLPNLGMGKAAAQNRSDIINKAASDFPDVSFATNKAAFQANTNSLKNLQKQADQTDAFENTAGKNIDIFLNAAKGIIDTGSPLLNRPARAISESVFGSQNMAAFNAARETALTEAAKVLESPQGGGALTVSGRDAVKTLSNSNATLGQQVSAMKVLRSDMANRKQSNVDQIKAINDRINTTPNTAAAPPSAQSQFKEGDTATNPQTKAKFKFTGGQWIAQ